LFRGVVLLDIPKILIIDDELVNLKLLEISFQKEGFKTVTATNGADGYLLARKEQPDLILLDIMMPGENGLQTCARLKDTPDTTDIPVIFLTAMDNLKHKVEGLSIGAVDYITKPFEKREVLVRVRLHIKLGRAYRALIQEQRKKLETLQLAQQSILIHPSDIPSAGFEVYYKAKQEAGGDFYDVIQISDGIFGYLAADVSGHDLGASFITSALKALIRQNATPLLTPQETIKMINSVLHSFMSDGQHLTACYLHLNRLSSRITVISAGHPAVLYFNAQQGTAEFLDVDGDVLGPFDMVYLKPLEKTVTRGDRMFLYTDGLIETLASGFSRSDGRKKLHEIGRAHV
jgi:sigma-B regulation protein RsbU (phosphoserine phosphatase)